MQIIPPSRIRRYPIFSARTSTGIDAAFFSIYNTVVPNVALRFEGQGLSLPKNYGVQLGVAWSSVPGAADPVLENRGKRISRTCLKINATTISYFRWHYLIFSLNDPVTTDRWSRGHCLIGGQNYSVELGYYGPIQEQQRLFGNRLIGLYTSDNESIFCLSTNQYYIIEMDMSLSTSPLYGTFLNGKPFKGFGTSLINLSGFANVSLSTNFILFGGSLGITSDSHDQGGVIYHSWFATNNRFSSEIQSILSQYPDQAFRY